MTKKNDPFGLHNWEQRLLALKKAELQKVANAWNDWFVDAERSGIIEDDDYLPIPKDATKAKIVDLVVWHTDPITTEGGLLDFLNTVRISSGTVSFKQK